VEAGLGGEACGVLKAAIVFAGYAFAKVVRLDEAAGGGVEVCAGEFLGGSVIVVEVEVVLLLTQSISSKSSEIKTRLEMMPRPGAACATISMVPKRK
jgi:hypothetical protein